MKYLVLLVCLLPAGAATAELVTYRFSGTVDKINYNHNGVFPEGHLGQPFSGWFSYQSDSCTSEIGDCAFTIGSVISPVLSDRLYALVDLDTISFRYYGKEGNYDYGRTGLHFSGYSGPAFGSGLPTAIDLSMFSDAIFQITGSKFVGGVHQGSFNISGAVDTLELIPEPASFALVAFGVLLKRRR